MIYLKKILVGVCSYIVISLAFPTHAIAVGNFTTNAQVTYLVNSTGQTQVTQNIELINRTPTLYAKQYGLKISSPDIKNVQVTTNGQSIIPEVVQSDNQTSIGITFPDEMVGEGKVRKIEIAYVYPNSAAVSGKVLEVLVPKLANASDYDNYQVTLITPAEFGTPTRTSPAQYESRQDSNRVVTTFQPQRGTSITALFGQQQIFELRLRYHLANTSSNPAIAQVALPPDTGYQKLDYQVLEPYPSNIEHDADGNWIATYEVAPQTEVTVYAVAKVLITLDQATNFPQLQPTSSATREQEFWETKTEVVTDILPNLSSARSIYDYVVNHLSYNYQNIDQPLSRLGAANALHKPNEATCQEFTDVFVTLARAKNIPAKRVTGFAYTQNPILRPLSLETDILHAWPIFFDDKSQSWKQVDPTWENTTGGVNYFDQFDLNHITFAINGESSTRPFPAGAYKTLNQNNKDVEVVFSPTFPNQSPNFVITPHTKKQTGLMIPGKNQVTLINRTGRAWYDVRIEPSQLPDDIRLSGLPIILPVVLPYQHIDLDLSAFSRVVSIQTQRELELNLSYKPDERTNISTNGTSTNAERVTIPLSPIKVSVGPYYLEVLLQPTSLIGLGIGSLILTGLTGSLLVHGRRRSRTVRRKS